MAKRVRKLKKKIRKAGGIDILLTHAPMAGYGEMEDLCHKGFECFKEILDEFKPKYMFYGHVHPEYGNYGGEFSYNNGKTKIMNVCGVHFLDL